MINIDNLKILKEMFLETKGKGVFNQAKDCADKAFDWNVY